MPSTAKHSRTMPDRPGASASLDQALFVTPQSGVRPVGFLDDKPVVRLTRENPFLPKPGAREFIQAVRSGSIIVQLPTGRRSSESYVPGGRVRCSELRPGTVALLLCLNPQRDYLDFFVVRHLGFTDSRMWGTHRGPHYAELPAVNQFATLGHLFQKYGASSLRELERLERGSLAWERYYQEHVLPLKAQDSPVGDIPDGVRPWILPVSPQLDQAALAELETFVEGKFGPQFSVCFSNLLTNAEKPWIHIVRGKWVMGHSADVVQLRLLNKLEPNKP